MDFYQPTDFTRPYLDAPSESVLKRGPCWRKEARERAFALSEFETIESEEFCILHAHSTMIERRIPYGNETD
jgi:hypothetical protein